MKVKIQPSIASGRVNAPPSKSYAHRLLICAALSYAKCVIDGVANSKDMEATLNCLSALNIDFVKENDRTTILGKGKKNNKEEARRFYCNESGSTIRFFIPIALVLGGANEFYGTERLLSRGFDIYYDICKEQSIEFFQDKEKITFNGTLRASEFNVRGDISSQFISGLLFALPMLEGDSVINITTHLESAPYVDITIDALKQFGIEITKRENGYFIKGNQKYQPQNVVVEGDMSNGAFLDAFNFLGGSVKIEGLKPDSLQADSVYFECMQRLCQKNCTIDITSCPDLAPILFALAACKNGATFTGTKRLKIKESDRAGAMATEIKKFGIQLDVFENSVVVKKGTFSKPKEILYGHNDHRVVMALSVISSIYGGEIEGCEAVSKSYPNFFDDLTALGIKCEVVE